MLENIEGAIKNGHSRETDNIIKGTQDEDKQNKKTTRYMLLIDLCLLECLQETDRK